MATDHYIGIPKRRLAAGDLGKQGMTNGTSGTATNYIELRWQSDTGSGATGVTRTDVLIALEDFSRYITEGGLIGDGTDVPPPP